MLHDLVTAKKMSNVPREATQCYDLVKLLRLNRHTGTNPNHTNAATNTANAGNDTTGANDNTNAADNTTNLLVQEARGGLRGAGCNHAKPCNQLKKGFQIIFGTVHCCLL